MIYGKSPRSVSFQLLQRVKGAHGVTPPYNLSLLSHVI
jgi:hypothetical protein